MLRQDVKFTFSLQLVLALITLIGAVSFVMQLEISVLFSLLVVFLLPFISVALWFFKKKRNIHYVGRLRQFALGFRVTIIVGWCVLLMPALFWGAIYFYILEPWPFSLKQGPDTTESIEGFQRVMGFEADAEIGDIYYKGYEFRDYNLFLRFESCNEILIGEITQGLVQNSDGSGVTSLRLNSRLSWWFNRSQSSAFEHWARDFREVWLDRQTCTVYVHSWTT
ncbi:MAG: hypothetical protein GKR91_09345 [Pseudomonadales bacterium]|nr:hypothetical protein [Pseudomonadales bacterium]